MTPEQVRVAFRAMRAANGDVKLAARALAITPRQLTAWIRSCSQLQAALKDGVTPYSEEEAVMRSGDDAVALSRALMEAGEQVRSDFASIGLSPDLAGHAAMLVQFGQFNFDSMMSLTSAGLVAGFIRLGKVAQDLQEYIERGVSSDNTPMSPEERAVLLKQLSELVATQTKIHASVREDLVARAQIDAAMRDAKPSANKKTPGPAMAPASVNINAETVTVQEARPALAG